MPSIHLMCSDPISKLRWRELKKSNISAAGLNRLKTSVFAPLHSTGSVQHTLICPTVKTLQLLCFTTPHTIRGHSEELDIIIGSASAHAQRTYIFSSLNAPCLLYTRSPVQLQLLGTKRGEQLVYSSMIGVWCAGMKLREIHTGVQRCLQTMQWHAVQCSVLYVKRHIKKYIPVLRTCLHSRVEQSWDWHEWHKEPGRLKGRPAI